MTQPTIEEKTSYCDSVPCTIHDHSDWLDRVKDYNSNQPTIKEKMEKLLTDEIFNPEPCDIRLFATNIARLICEEMNANFDPEDQYQTEFAKARARGWNQREEKIRNKAQEILKTLE